MIDFEFETYIFKVKLLCHLIYTCDRKCIFYTLNKLFHVAYKMKKPPNSKKMGVSLERKICYSFIRTLIYIFYIPGIHRWLLTSECVHFFFLITSEYIHLNYWQHKYTIHLWERWLVIDKTFFNLGIEVVVGRCFERSWMWFQFQQPATFFF